jgi:hypothetical protein
MSDLVRDVVVRIGLQQVDTKLKVPELGPATEAVKKHGDAVRQVTQHSHTYAESTERINRLNLRAAAGFEHVGEGSVHFARGLMMLSASGEGSFKEMAKQMEQALAMFDLFKGGFQIIKGGVHAIDYLSKAHRVAAAAAGVQAVAEGTVTTALVAEEGAAVAAAGAMSTLSIATGVVGAAVAIGVAAWYVYKNVISDNTKEVKKHKEELERLAEATRRIQAATIEFRGLSVVEQKTAELTVMQAQLGVAQQIGLTEQRRAEHFAALMKIDAMPAEERQRVRPQEEFKYKLRDFDKRGEEIGMQEAGYNAQRKALREQLDSSAAEIKKITGKAVSAEGSAGIGALKNELERIDSQIKSHAMNAKLAEKMAEAPSSKWRHIGHALTFGYVDKPMAGHEGEEHYKQIAEKEKAELEQSKAKYERIKELVEHIGDVKNKQIETDRKSVEAAQARVQLSREEYDYVVKLRDAEEKRTQGIKGHLGHLNPLEQRTLGALTQQIKKKGIGSLNDAQLEQFHKLAGDEEVLTGGVYDKRGAALVKKLGLSEVYGGVDEKGSRLDMYNKQLQQSAPKAQNAADRLAAVEASTLPRVQNVIEQLLSLHNKLGTRLAKIEADIHATQQNK